MKYKWLPLSSFDVHMASIQLPVFDALSSFFGRPGSLQRTMWITNPSAVPERCFTSRVLFGWTQEGIEPEIFGLCSALRSVHVINMRKFITEMFSIY